MPPFEFPSVRYWSKEINGTRIGGRKRNFFNSRPRAPYGQWRPRRLNPVNPCRIGVPGFAKGRYCTRASAYTAYAAAASILGRFLSAAHATLAMFRPILLPGLSEGTRLPHRWRMRYRQIPTTRPSPEAIPEPICPRKKCAIWTRSRPVPVKNVNHPKPPSSRRSGIAGSHTTPPIVNYKYMTSTPREGYFGPTTSGT